MAVRLFVGNLPYDTTESEIRELFSQIGPLSFVSLPADRETGKPRGFAFIEYGDRALGESAISSFDGQLFKGRRLAVNEAREKERAPLPGAPSRLSAPKFDRGPGPTTAQPPSGIARTPGNYGPDAPPKRIRKKPKKGGDSERRPKRPIPEITRGQYFGGDEYDQEEQLEGDLFEDNFASRLGGDEDE
jgi:RNA recognition motif-containing protein